MRSPGSPDCTAADHAGGGARQLPPPALLERAAAMLRAAGEPARLGLLARLRSGEQCVTALAGASGDAMPTVSQRLQLLRREGLVRNRREGKHVFYELADAHVVTLLENVLHHAEEAG